MKTNVLDAILHGLPTNCLLPGSREVVWRLRRESDRDSLAELYQRAYERGDWFGGRVSPAHWHEKGASMAALLSGADGVRTIVFEDPEGVLLGSTSLFLCEDGSVLIDETQIDPILGRRRGIMSSYFRAVHPALEGCGRVYWTEFILTLGSGVLRRVLLGELGMLVSGIYPFIHSSPFASSPRVCLVAYAPRVRIAGRLAAEVESEVHADYRRFLECLLGDASEVLGSGQYSLVPHPSGRDRASKGSVQVQSGTPGELPDPIWMARAGAIPTAYWPTSSKFTVSTCPAAWLSEVSFLYDEPAREPRQLLAYLSGGQGGSLSANSSQRGDRQAKHPKHDANPKQ